MSFVFCVIIYVRVFFISLSIEKPLLYQQVTYSENKCMLSDTIKSNLTFPENRKIKLQEYYGTQSFPLYKSTTIKTKPIIYLKIPNLISV